RPSLPIHVPSVVPEHPEGGAENSEELWGYFERKGLTPTASSSPKMLDVNRSLSANAVIPKRAAKLTLSPSLNSLSTTTTRPPVKMTQRITRANIPQDVGEDGFDTTRPAVSTLSPRTILSSSPRTPQTASSIRTPGLTADGQSPISPYTPRTPVYFSKPIKPRAQRSLTDSKVIGTGGDRPATRPSHTVASLLSTNGRLPPPPALPLQSGSNSPNRAISPNRPRHLASHSSSAALPSPSEPSSSMAQAQSQSQTLYIPPPLPSPPFESIIPTPFDTDEDFALSLPSLGVTMPVTPSTPGTPWMGVDSSRKDPDADSIIIPPSPGFPLITAEERQRKNPMATR
ncbi:5071_t:CDS:1, partial [Acaulospora colombiana]